MFSEVLSKGRFIEVISEDYNKKLGREVELHDEISLTYGLISIVPNFRLYYDKDNGRCYLSDDDINDALNNYAKSRELVLDSFAYLGGVHRMGMFIDEDTPYFFGVRLNLDEKELKTDSPLVKERKLNE